MTATISVLTVITGIIGLAGLVALARVVTRAARISALRPERGRAEATVDLLNYALPIADGIILGKDGSLMAAWTYRAPDASGSTAHEQNALADALSRALRPLGNGWMMHIDGVRTAVASYCTFTEFGDDVSAAIDEERRTYFANNDSAYEGYSVLTVTYLPPVNSKARFESLLFDDSGQNTVSASGERHLAIFERELQALEDRLPFALERLRTRSAASDHGPILHDEFLRWLNYCVLGRSEPIAVPKHGAFLDALIGCQDLEMIDDDMRIGQNWVQVVAIDGFPLQSCPGMLNHLAELACEYRWSTRAIFLDPQEGISQLDKYRRKWRQKVRGFMDQMTDRHNGPIDQDALDMVYDAESATAAINSGEAGPLYYTSVVVLMDENRDAVKHAARETARIIARLGFSGTRIETNNLVSAYLGSLPGHGVQNVRRPLLNTMDVADLMPTTSIWAGAPTAPCPFYPPQSPPMMVCVAQGSTPFRFNLHHGDIGHTLMFGPTGAGKSTHLALLVAQMRRYSGMQIFAFDKGLSLYPLASAINAATQGQSGLHFELGGDNLQMGFAPLSKLDTDGDLKWAAEWIDMLMRLSGVQTSVDQRNEIDSALKSMQQTGSRTMSDLRTTIQDTELAGVLRQYTLDAPMGHLLDAEHDSITLSDFTVFEIEELINLSERIALPVLTYLFRRIERSFDGRPAAIILDEAWIMLGHEAFRTKIREWLKVLRKSNCLVLMSTQSLSDASRSGILDVLVESCPTKIFLPNPNAISEDGSALYKQMGLNTRQIELIARATPKRQYYYTSPEGQRLYELAMGPLALALCAASGKQDLATIRELQAQHGHQWLTHWLASRGIPWHPNSNTQHDQEAA